MALTINEPIKTVNGLLTEALAASSQLLYVITTDIDLNSVNNYRINVEIRDAADTFALFDKVFSYIPNAAGVLDLDVGETVTRYMKDQGLFSFQYFLRVVEVWQGSGESSTDTTILQGVLAKKQLLKQGGANMWENLLRALQFTETYSAIQDVGGFTRLTLDGASDTTTQYTVGEMIYITFSGVSYTDGYYELTAAAFITGSTRLSFGIVFAGTDSGTTEITVSKEFSSIQDITGTIRINLRGSADLSGNYSVGQFVFLNFTSNIYSDGYYAITQSVYISNITRLYFDISFVGTDSGTVTAENARFLTKFKNPVMVRGWNRTVSLLIDSEFSTRNPNDLITVSNANADVNKNRINSNGTSLSIANPATNVYIAPVNESASFYNSVVCTTGAATGEVSETLYYLMQNECKNPIMLDWINSLGGIENWLFSTSQAIQIVSDSGIVAERPINTDIEFITRTKQRFANTFRQQLTLRAHNLTFDQLLALQEIKQTESLRVYLSKDGANFIDGIVITTFTTDYNNKRNDHKFIVVIELPDGFIFEEGKLY